MHLEESELRICIEVYLELILILLGIAGKKKDWNDCDIQLKHSICADLIVIKEKAVDDEGAYDIANGGGHKGHGHVEGGDEQDALVPEVEKQLQVELLVDGPRSLLIAQHGEHWEGQLDNKGVQVIQHPMLVS